jgi:hypothetical protein
MRQVINYAYSAYNVSVDMYFNDACSVSVQTYFDIFLYRVEDDLCLFGACARTPILSVLNNPKILRSDAY